MWYGSLLLSSNTLRLIQVNTIFMQHNNTESGIYTGTKKVNFLTSLDLMVIDYTTSDS